MENYVKTREINHFAFKLIEFMSELHDYHICRYPLIQINGKGKKRTFCTKYNRPMKNVRFDCIDKPPVIDTDNLKKLRRTQKMELIINGVAV